MNRRAVLKATGILVTGPLAGCTTSAPAEDSRTASTASATTTPAHSVGDATWPMVQADAENTAHHPDTTGPSPSPDTRWKFDASGDVAPPVVRDGMVYITTTDGDMYAIGEPDGTERWQHEKRLSALGPPAIEDGLVYVIETGHRLLAVSADTGTTQWTVSMGDQRHNWVQTAPTIAAETIYLQATDFQTYAVDAATGDVRWRVDTRSSIPRTPAVAQDSVFVVSHGRRKLSALAAADGSEQWQFVPRYPDRDVAIRTRPTFHDGILYAGIEADNPRVTHTASGRVYAINTGDGTETWQGDTDDPVVATAVDGETIYATTLSAGHNRTGTIYAFELGDGTRRWQFRLDDRGFSSPVVVDDTVYTTTSTQRHDDPNHLIALDAGDGSERWSKRIDDEPIHGVIVVNETAYVNSPGAVSAVG